MAADNEKWARISALRPAAGSAPRAEKIPDRLADLLEAELRTNHLGSHLVTRRVFPEPGTPDFRPEPFRLLAAPSCPEVTDARRWLFLDTETTGLAGGTGTYAFLVGLGWWEEGGFCVEQFFMRDPGEEKSMLAALADRLAEDRVLVTFNGKSFDWPLLETRYRLCRAGAVAGPRTHLDLLYPARRLWRLRLASVALSELERHVLAFDRGPDIPSETIPRRYFDYLRAGIVEPIVEVFQHNRMDLVGLARLALEIVRILEDPEGSRPEELFGVSRMMQRAGESEAAERCYRQALANGLPRAAGKIAQRELAGMARRRGDFDQANTLWEELLEDTPAGLDAYEQLAIHYEHRAREIERAISLTREALVRLQEVARAGRIPMSAYRSRHASLQHRLDRLHAKRPPSRGE